MNFFEFGMLDLKLLVSNSGDETTVTIYLSKPAYKNGNCFEYDPVNEVWLDFNNGESNEESTRAGRFSGAISCLTRPPPCRG